jgi:sugar phosphate isomerase/epimerase
MWSPSDLRVPVPFDGMEEVLQEAAGRGLGAEFQGLTNPDRLEASYPSVLERARRAFRGFTGAVALHAPFLDLNPVSPDPAVASASHRRTEQAFEAAEAIGATLIVFHSQFGAMNRDSRYPEAWLSRSREYWSARIPRLEASGLRVAIENIFETDPGPVCRLVDALASPRIRACLDVGHAHLFSGDAASFARGLGDRVAHVHLHDNQGVWDDHRAPGSGSAGAAGAMAVLAGLAARPSLTLEMARRDEVAKAVQWLGEQGFLAPA